MGTNRRVESVSDLRLRPPTGDDVVWITDACADADIQRFTRVPAPYERRDAEVFVASAGGSLVVWAVVDALSDAGVGMVAIHDVVDGVADAGYWVAPWARRRGVATWALRALVVEAATEWGATRVVLDIATVNVASEGVARAAGFVAIATPEDLSAPDGESDVPATRWVCEVG